MKIAVGLMLVMFLVGTTITAIPVKAAFVGTIKVGIIGPQGLPHWSPAGMLEASEMAAAEINTAGGVSLPDGAYSITLASGNEYAVPTPNPDAAAGEVERLITDEGCQFLIGGFRTECTSAMIPVAMGYNVPFIIDGASTTELISCYGTPGHPGGTPPGPACGHCVYDNYATYKYLFRVMPTNSTVLVKTLAAYIQFLIGTNLLSKYGYVHPGMTRPQVDVAVLTEALEWANLIHLYLTTPTIYPGILGIYANVTYSGRIPDGETNCASWLQGVKDNKARIMVHVFSGTTGDPLIRQWKEMDVRALPIGINVMGQLQDHWANTNGKCEGEIQLITSGTRTPIVPGQTTVFWDNFLVKSGGRWPIYTAFGAYSALYVLKDAIERAGTLNAANVVTALENTDAHAEDPGQIASPNFKFSQYHDLYCNPNDLSYTWSTGYGRPLVAQWQAGRLEIVSPIDKTAYSRQTMLTRNMYPYPTDVNQDKKVDGSDSARIIYGYDTVPGDARWLRLADVNDNQTITTSDYSDWAWDYTKWVLPPLGYLQYGNEAGWLQYPPP